MTVDFARRIQSVDAVVGVEIEEEGFELGDLAVGSFVDLRQAVDGADARIDLRQLQKRYAIAFVYYHDIRVGDLEVGGRFMRTGMR